MEEFKRRRLLLRAQGCREAAARLINPVQIRELTTLADALEAEAGTADADDERSVPQDPPRGG